ncbi:MupG family TIM beta-alpha barrel fold protein [Aerococcus sp. NPDC058936]|uniref:MupG family TIM beta-alpha barrel fold protein n=1 Tax=Aerococcus sp. NPDC058936 TaxID=3346674 RepID=UPI00366E5196
MYLEKASFGELRRYLELAVANGFQRIFSCLLSAEEDKTSISLMKSNLGRNLDCKR